MAEDITVETADNADEANEANEAKKLASELLEGASLERLQAITSLLSLPDAKAMVYGDALSLIIDTEYNIGILKQAVRDIKEEEGLKIIRTRTTVRVFKYYKDEDDPSIGFIYRAFYVSAVTPEQKIALGVGKTDQFRNLLSKGFTEKDIQNKPEKLLELINSDAFEDLMVEPNKVMRSIVLENMVEVLVSEDGIVKKPARKLSKVLPDRELSMVLDNPHEESVLQQLEEDLALLIEQQGILAKNPLMTDM